MVTLLRKLISRLGDTVDAWKRFQRKDIGYFLFDDGLPTSSSLLTCSVNAVDNVFLDLKDILSKFRQLEEKLCQDSPQGVSDLPLAQIQWAALCWFYAEADRNSLMLT
jgi:hypothetical protein